jgi:hypothetical protein
MPEYVSKQMTFRAIFWFSAAVAAFTSSQARADCSAEIVDIASSINTQGPYEEIAEEVISLDFNDVSARRTIALRAPPNFFLSNYRGGKLTNQRTAIDGKYWARDPGGVWKPESWPKEVIAKLQESPEVKKTAEIKELTGKIRDSNCLGTVDHLGRKALKFIYETADSEGARHKHELFVDPASKLPIRSVHAFSMKQVGNIRTTTEFRFDPSIRIEAPGP